MRAQGPLGIYRGIGITLLRDCPSYGLYFSKFKRITYDGYLTYMLYSHIRRTKAHLPVHEGPWSDSIYFWSVDGWWSIWVWCLDSCLSSRCHQESNAKWSQVRKEDTHACANCLQICNRIKSSVAAFRALVREAGYKAFFNGVGPTMARAFPANAATFFAYELAMKAMN